MVLGPTVAVSQLMRQYVVTAEARSNDDVIRCEQDMAGIGRYHRIADGTAEHRGGTAFARPGNIRDGGALDGEPAGIGPVEFRRRQDRWVTRRGLGAWHGRLRRPIPKHWLQHWPI